MPREFEYDALRISMCNEEEIKSVLSKRGKEGWEVVTSIPDSSELVFVLKRSQGELDLGGSLSRLNELLGRVRSANDTAPCW